MLNKQAQTFAAAAAEHLNDLDFPKFAEPLILEMMAQGDSNQTIAEALFDGMEEATKDIEKPNFTREEFVTAAASGGAIVDLRAVYDSRTVPSFTAEDGTVFAQSSSTHTFGGRPRTV